MSTAAKRRAATRDTDQRYLKARKKILATAEICAICGQPLHPELKYPHPLSSTVDHIVPVARGGSNYDPANLQAAHLICNVKKSDSLPPDDDGGKKSTGRKQTISNRVLPASMDWSTYVPRSPAPARRSDSKKTK